MSQNPCSQDYGNLMADQNLYEKALNQNPSLASQSIDPGSCQKTNTTSSTTLSTNTKSSTTVVVVTDFGGGGGKSKSTSNTKETNQYNATSSKGCAAIAAQYCLQAAVNNGLNCAFNSTTSDTKSSANEDLSISIEISDSTIEGNLNIKDNQSGTIAGQVKNFNSSTLQSAMASNVQTQLKNLQSSTQKTSATNVNFAPTGSQKSFNDTISGAVNSTSNQTISKIIAKTISGLKLSEGATVNLTGLTIKGNANISEVQTAAESFIIQQITDNITSNMMTVKAVDTSTTTQKSTQSTKVSGRAPLSAIESSLSKTSSHIILFGLMFLGLVGFSLIEAPKKIRAGCFYLACLMFLIILIADHSKNSVVLWLSIVAFAIGCIVNVKEWKVSNSMMIGGGFSDGILPYPKKQDYYDSQRDQQGFPSLPNATNETIPEATNNCNNYVRGTHEETLLKSQSTRESLRMEIGNYQKRGKNSSLALKSS